MGSNIVKRIISFIWPIITKVESRHNGTLEICWYNGRKMLNSKNANYSFGSLQKTLILGLSKITIDVTAPILLLGLGGGSIIGPLRTNFGCSGNITAVEWDEVVLKLAIQEFDINNALHVNLIHAEASVYVESTKQSFGLIIIDLFIDDVVPEVFYSLQFWANVVSLVRYGGSILFNAGIHVNGDVRVKRVKKLLEETAYVRVLENVQGSNTLLLANFDK